MLLTLFVILCGFLIMKLIERHRMFSLREKLGLKGPPTNFINGNMDHIFRIIQQKGVEKTVDIFPDLCKEYGDIFGFYYGPYLELIITDPELVKEVFIAQFRNFVDRKKIAINMAYPMLNSLLQVDVHGTLGVGWKEIRTTMSSIFTSGKMKKMHPLVHGSVADLIEELRLKCSRNGGRTDIYGEYQAITMEVISKCALGQDLSCIKDRNNSTYELARTFLYNLNYSRSLLFKASLVLPFLRHFRRFSLFGQAEATLVGELSERIHERRKQRASGDIRPLPDLIDLILAENEQRAEPVLHHDVIVSNAWAFFFAGYETTSTALAYTSHLLATHPQAQQTLYDEVLATFGTNGEVDYDRVMKLPYLHAVFCESLRLLPPVLTFTGRQCIKDTVIGGKYRIPAGVNVQAPVHAIMWDERNYDDARVFRPERFLDEGKASWSPVLMPFGIGPRNCVGARFAEMEYKTVLAEIVRGFRFDVDPEQPELKSVMCSALHTPLNNELYLKLSERI